MVLDKDGNARINDTQIKKCCDLSIAALLFCIATSLLLVLGSTQSRYTTQQKSEKIRNKKY